MRNIAAIFKKQLKDTLKNKSVLIFFIMFPLMTLLFGNAVKDSPENFFVTMFAGMHLGMAPMMSIAAIIAEEKEKNTLRVLLMSNVKPHEYLLGVGSYIWLGCILGAGAICAMGNYTQQERIIFMTVMAVGILASLLFGAAIGVWSKNQMTSTSISLPVMAVFSFTPMLSMFNEKIAKIAKYLYSEQISRMLNNINDFQLGTENIIIIAVNISAAVLFAVAYKKRMNV